MIYCILGKNGYTQVMVNLFYNLECILLKMSIIRIIIGVNFNLYQNELYQTNLYFMSIIIVIWLNINKIYY